MHQVCYEGLGSNDVNVRNVAALLTAFIAKIELPRNEWREIIGFLCDKNLKSNNICLRTSSLTTIGIICEEVNPQDILEYCDQLLTVIIKEVNENDPQLKVIALRALTNSCNFITKNFNNDKERNYIMSVILNSAKPSNAPVVIENAFKCLNEIAYYYYDKLTDYIKAMFDLSVANISSSEETVVTAINDLWYNIAQIEFDMIENDEPDCLKIIEGVAPYLVPYLLNCMEKQSEDQEPEDWNGPLSAATCLDQIAACCGDKIFEIVFKFISANINSQDWHKREAAIFAFGCILQENSRSTVLDLPVTQILPVFLDQLQHEKLILVRETTIFTINRIISCKAGIIANHFDNIMTTMLQNLNQEPRITSVACNAIKEIIYALRVSGKNSVLYSMKTTKLTEYFKPVIEQMINVCRRSDANVDELHQSAVDVMSEIIQGAPDNILNLVEQLLPLYCQQLKESLSPNSSTKDYISPFLIVVNVCIERLRERILSLPAFNLDDLMGLILLAMNNASVFSEAIQLAQNIADIIETSFIKYFPAMKPIIFKTLETSDAPDLCIIIIQSLGEIYHSMGNAAAPFSEELVILLLKELANPNINRTVKPNIFRAFADIAMALGNDFEKYTIEVLKRMQEAQNIAISVVPSNDDDDFQDFINELIVGLLNCYSSFILSIQSSAFKSNIAKPALEFALTCYPNHRDCDEVIKCICSLIGDVAQNIGNQALQYLNTPNVASILNDVINSTIFSDDIISLAKWAKNTIENLIRPDNETKNNLSSSITIKPKRELKHKNKMFQSMVNNPSSNSSNKEDYKNAGNLILFDNSGKIEHSLSVKWDITNPDINDNIALYQHHRYHDKNFIQIFNIQGVKQGIYTFTNLVDGYYDVRLLRGTTQKHDKYVKSNVCCLGPEVELNYELIEDNKQQYLKVIVNSKFVKSKNDCIALFYNTEHSNKLMKSVMYNYLNTATDNGDNKEMIFKIKHIHGLFSIRYFYYNSLSMIYGNVYSGSKTIKLKNYNELGIVLDDRFKQLKVYWRLYTIDPNDSQWIGIYENDKLLTYEYISKHHYLNELHTEGVVIIGHKKTYNKSFDMKEDDELKKISDLNNIIR